MLPLDGELEFDPQREGEFFAALPARPAVFLVEPRQAGARPYLLSTMDLRRRAERLLRAPEMPSKRLNLREVAARVRYRLTGSRFEQSLLFYQHARERFPRRYRALVRLPALLKVNLASEYPRCYVTHRILSDSGFYFGPFASRKAAEAFANDFLDLFKLRRCQIKIRRDPNFPGCIYSEMKMCLAPCFGGSTKAEYDVEVGHVLDFLGSRGTTLASEFEQERETASRALDFERAAALHRKLEKVAEILGGLGELARKVDELDAVVLQPAAEGNTIALFAVCGGRIADPFFLRFGELASQPRSVEEILREALKPAIGTDERGWIRGDHGPRRVGMAPGSGPRPVAEELAEHLGLLARWFYSKPRKGEIFFRSRARGRKESAAADWPYRRIIRACSRLLAPTEPPSSMASS